MANKKITIDIDANTQPAEESVKNLKQQYRDAVQEAQKLASTPGPELDAAIAKAAELKDTMNDVNEQVAVLTAGSPFEKMANGLGDVGSKLASLDFEGAKESAGRLVQISKSITFGEAIKGVKDLGSTFLQLGKALLTNPLFLIGAAIALLVIGIVKLMDKLGLLKVITKAIGDAFDLLMVPINAIIDGLKALTDMWGWTNNAAIDSAEQQSKAAEKTATAYEEKSNRIISGYDHEIRMLELAGKSTREVELKKVYYINETAKARAKADRLAYQSAKLRGDLDEEELEDLRKKMNASKDAYVQSGYAITETKAKFAKEDKDKRKKDAEDEAKSNDEKNKKIADANKKAREEEKNARKQALADIAAAEKLYSDSKLSDRDKELAASKAHFDRLIALAEKYKQSTANLIAAKVASETEINNKFNEEDKKKQEEKDAEALALRQKAFDNIQKLDQLELKVRQANLDKIQDDESKSYDERKKLSQERELELTDIALTGYNERLEDLQFQLDNKLITQEEYDAESKLAEVEYQNELTNIQKNGSEERTKLDEDEHKKKIANLQSFLKSTSDIFKQFDGLFASALSNTLTGIGSLVELSEKEFENTTEKVAAYTQAIGDILQGFAGAFADSIKAKSEEALTAVNEDTANQMSVLDNQLKNGLISQEQYERQKESIDKAAKAKELEIKKKAFEDDKKVKIAQAAIAGIQGAVAAFAGAMQLGPIAGPIVGGVLAAAVGVLTGINISKIKQTQFNGGGSSAGGGGISAGASSAAATPSFNMFGGANQGNNLSQGQSAQGNQTIVVQNNVEISETEITKKQNTVKKIESGGSISL